MMFSSRQNGKEKRNGGKKNCEMAGRKVKWREDTIQVRDGLKMSEDIVLGRKTFGGRHGQGVFLSLL